MTPHAVHVIYRHAGYIYIYIYMCIYIYICISAKTLSVESDTSVTESDTQMATLALFKASLILTCLKQAQQTNYLHMQYVAQASQPTIHGGYQPILEVLGLEYNLTYVQLPLFSTQKRSITSVYIYIYIYIYKLFLS